MAWFLLQTAAGPVKSLYHLSHPKVSFKNPAIW